MDDSFSNVQSLLYQILVPLSVCASGTAWYWVYVIGRRRPLDDDNKVSMKAGVIVGLLMFALYILVDANSLMDSELLKGVFESNPRLFMIAFGALGVMAGFSLINIATYMMRYSGLGVISMFSISLSLITLYVYYTVSIFSFLVAVFAISYLIGMFGFIALNPRRLRGP